jgi:hypothetical protein
MTKLSIFLWTILLLTLIVTAYLVANRPRKVVIEATVPADFPADNFSHAAFEELLQRFVTHDGHVDYENWQLSSRSVAQLDSYLAAVSHYSPDNTPQRFNSRNDALAYWIYGYNAYVIKSVLDNWPLDSVTDVKAPIEAVKGLGFFHQLRFSFGGEYMSLMSVENNKIRSQYQDARIHFVLNCASESCPIARPDLPTGDDLDQLLTTAAAEFINDARNVSVNHDSRIVFLSSIFKWYEKDFLQDLRAAGKPTDKGLSAYIAQYAAGSLAQDLARSTDYDVEFRDYDWSLNSKE